MSPTSTRALRTLGVFAVVGATVTTAASALLYLAVAATWTWSPAYHGLLQMLRSPQVLASAWLFSLIPNALTGVAAWKLKRSTPRRDMIAIVLAGGILSAAFDVALHGGLDSSLQFFLLGALSAWLSVLTTANRPARIAAR